MKIHVYMKNLYTNAYNALFIIAQTENTPKPSNCWWAQTAGHRRVMAQPSETNRGESLTQAAARLRLEGRVRGTAPDSEGCSCGVPPALHSEKETVKANCRERVPRSGLQGGPTAKQRWRDVSPGGEACVKTHTRERTPKGWFSLCINLKAFF